MSYYLVRTGWMGNGEEAVIVAADNEADARDIASQQLVFDTSEAMLRLGDNLPRIRTHMASKLDTYERPERFEVEEIALPYVTEVS